MISSSSFTTSRRKFLVGCSAGIAAMAGARLGPMALGSPASSGSQEVLVMVFLRGGMDGLSLLPPLDGEDRRHYEEARPELMIPLTGPNAAIRLNAQFGLHPSARPLVPLFQAGKLAIIQAVGSGGSRSHFDAMRYIELGTPGIKNTPDGWLTRHLQSAPTLGKTILLPALAAASSPPASLQGSNEGVNLSDANVFSLSQWGHWSWVLGDHRTALRRIYQLGDTFVHHAGIEALNAVGLIEAFVTPNYQASNGAVYPGTAFGQQLSLVARLIKRNVGLRVATVDLGGWDTHEWQGNENGTFSNNISDLSQSLAAFYTDLDGSQSEAPSKRLTVVVQSEFGRRIRQNASHGTDHGTANPILVLGGNVRGGIHGTWPGLAPDLRYDGADLAPTTDFRRVLSEILLRRFGNPNLGQVFPAYRDYTPLNIVSGPDVSPSYVVPPPEVPTGFTVISLAGAGYELRWNVAARASNYRIERRAEPDGAWQPLITLAAEQLRYQDLRAPAGTIVSYRIQAFGSFGESPYSPPTGAPVQTALEQWRLRYFGTTANAGPAANDRVATSDGLSNFTKYALGLDPLIPAPESTGGFSPGKPKTEYSQGVFSLIYVRPVGRVDVVYEVLGSSDLKNWETIAQKSDGTSDGFERLRAEAPRTGTPASYRFLKLVTRPG